MTRTSEPISFPDALNRAPMRAVQWLIAAVCMLILVCDGMDLQLLGIVAPLVMADFGVDPGTFGLAMSAALVGFGVGGWAGGWLGDRLGRRYTLALAALVFSLATVGAGSSGEVWDLAWWRLLGGIGFGAAYANALTMASEWMPDRWRPVVVSTLAVGTPIGGSIVGWVAPDIAAQHGWNAPFVYFGLGTLLVVVVVLAGLRDSPSFLLTRGKSQAAARAARLVLPEPFALAPDRISDALVGSTRVGFLDRAFLRMNLGIAVSFAASTLCAYGILSWTTTYLTMAGWQLVDAAKALSICGITSMIGSILVGIAIRRFGSRRVMMLLSVAMVVVMAALGLAVESLPDHSQPNDIALVTALVAAAGAIFSAAIAGMYVIMTHGYPASCRSSGIGFGVFMSRVGAIASSGFGGALLDFGAGSVVPFFTVLAISGAFISAAAFVIDRHVLPR